MKKLTAKQIIDIILILLLLIFAGQNVETVQLKFLFLNFNLPLIILLAFIFFVGFFTAKLFKSNKEAGKNESEKQTNVPESEQK